jgi:hypothetical protein
MAVDLRVIRIFIAVEVAPQKEARYQQYDDSHDKKYAESGIACSKALPAEISVRRGQWSWLICRPLGLRLIFSHRCVCIFRHDFYLSLL